MILDEEELGLLVATLEDSIAEMDEEDEETLRLVSILAKLDPTRLEVPEDAPQSPETLTALMSHLQAISEFVLDGDITSYAYVFTTTEDDAPKFAHLGLNWLQCSGLEAVHAIVLSRLIAYPDRHDFTQNQDN
jgi:hypothetical protein